MLRCSAKLLKNGKGLKYFSTQSVKQNKSYPQSADVVVIGNILLDLHLKIMIEKL